MTPLSDMNDAVDRLAGGHMRRILERQEQQIRAVLDEAHASGAIKGEVGVVLVFRRGAGWPNMQARLA